MVAEEWQQDCCSQDINGAVVLNLEDAAVV